MPADIKKILVVKPSSLGDVVHSLPFLDSIRRCFPDAVIDWVIARGLEGLLEGHPMIRNLIVIDKDSWKRPGRAAGTIGELRRLAASLRAERYDLAVDLQGLLRSGIITLFSGAPARVGFAEAREGSALCYNRRIEGGRDVHAVDRYLKVAASLGCEAKAAAFPFPASESSVQAAVPERYAVLVPGARWETKRWPAESFGRVAAALSLPSVVVGGPSDISLADRAVSASQGKAISLAGRTDLRGLIQVMRRAALVISNDSGPMHIAAGFGVPVVAIFGPTSPERTGPYGTGHVVIKGSVPCAPCFKRRCENPRCLNDISPEIVLKEAEGLLKSLSQA